MSYIVEDHLYRRLGGSFSLFKLEMESPITPGQYLLIKGTSPLDDDVWTCRKICSAEEADDGVQTSSNGDGQEGSKISDNMAVDGEDDQGQ